MSLRQQTLDLAILGRLMRGPSHGYELRKHVNMVMGYLHKVSFGSLYPALKRLLTSGYICDCGAGRTTLIVGNRSRRVYHLTSSGQEHLTRELAAAERQTSSDDDFGVRFSLFGITDPRTRLFILRGRRDHIWSRLAALDDCVQPDQDAYAQELVRHLRDSVAREMAWLDQVIAAEENAPVTGTVPSGAYSTKENR